MNLRTVLQAAVVVLCCCLLAIPAIAQQQQQQDTENERRLGLWFDQAISVGLPESRSLEFEFHQRLDEGASNLFKYFFQGGMAFRLRPWLTILPIYRYQRYPGDPSTSYENCLLLNLTVGTTLGRWRPILRTLTEGRFPQNRIASARVRLRFGIEYTLPLRMTRPPVVVVNNEFFIVLGTNSFASGSDFTQNRFQAGIRLPITDSFAIRPYYLRQSVHPPTGWDSNGVIGLPLALKSERLARSLDPVHVNYCSFELRNQEISLRWSRCILGLRRRNANHVAGAGRHAGGGKPCYNYGWGQTIGLQDGSFAARTRASRRRLSVNN